MRSSARNARPSANDPVVRAIVSATCVAMSALSTSARRGGAVLVRLGELASTWLA
jgi:hypothetical protein